MLIAENWNPTVTVLDHHDAFAEMTLEVGGRIVASTVVREVTGREWEQNPGGDLQGAESLGAQAYLVGELRRRC